MSNLDELACSYKVVCRRLQDSVKIIEAFMGSQQEMSFNMNSAIESLQVVDINAEETKVEQWMNVVSEYDP